MQLIRQIRNHKSAPPAAIAIGNFDGLHCGHQAVIGAMRAVAAEKNLVPSVLTFEPHPRQFFAPQAPAFRLEPRRTKFHRLRDAGVEQLFAPHFNAAFANMSAEAFLDEVLAQKLNARAVITGENFAFGKGRAGNADMLREWGQQHSIEVVRVMPVKIAGEVCSSSAIRQALQGGHMAHVADLLGRPYSISGIVAHGARRGHTIGYPTANIRLPALLKLPHFGVYATRSLVGDRWIDGVANLGVKPTVEAQARPSLEVHLFDFAGDLYGKRMETELLHFIREEKRFDSLAALTHQIALDAGAARQFLQEQA